MANRVKLNNITFSVGDIVRVYQKIQEGDKVRTQPFEGIVISIKGAGENKMFTVRKIATGGIGVERIWPILSPWIERIEVKKTGKTRRAKLYYLRKKVGKQAIKVKTREVKKAAPVKAKKIKPAHEKKESRKARRGTSRQEVKKE